MRLASFIPCVLFALFGCASASPSPRASEAAPSASAGPSAAPSVESSDQAVAPAPNASAAAAPSSAGSADSEPKVTLLDPGKAPRQKLRFLFTTKPETMVMDLKTRMRVRAGAQSVPEIALPTLRTVMRLVPEKVSPEGDLTYDGTVKRTEMLGDAKLPAQAKTELKQQLDQLVGLKVHSVVTSRGSVKALSVDIPPNTNPAVAQTLESIRESMRNLCSPFPEEAVGPGARWQVDSAVAAPVHLTQKAVFTLVSVTPKAAELTAKVEQSAPRQKVEVAGVAAGTKTELVSLKGQGDSKVTTAFARLTPVSRVSLDNDTVTNVEQGGNKVEVNTTLHLDMTIKPGE
jgi:hypothetical protein